MCSFQHESGSCDPGNACTAAARWHPNYHRDVQFVGGGCAGHGETTTTTTTNRYWWQSSEESDEGGRGDGSYYGGDGGGGGGYGGPGDKDNNGNVKWFTRGKEIGAGGGGVRPEGSYLKIMAVALIVAGQRHLSVSY